MIMNHVKFKEKETIIKIVFQAGKRNTKFNVPSNLCMYSDKRGPR